MNVEERIDNYLNEGVTIKSFTDSLEKLLIKKKFKKVKPIEKDEILFMSDDDKSGISIEIEDEDDEPWVCWGTFDIKKNGKRNYHDSGNDPLHSGSARELFRTIFS